MSLVGTNEKRRDSTSFDHFGNLRAKLLFRMNTELKKAWTLIIQPDDYEAHMKAVGQAQANAELVAEYFRCAPPPQGASLLFLGTGTGQMFEFISPSILLPYQATFTDINATFLARFSRRLQASKGLHYTTVVDDIEATRLTPGFHTVIVVLLLEHVDWRKAVSTIARLATRQAFVVVQENPANFAAAMTPAREITGTMKIFKDVHPTLIPRQELEAEFVRHRFVAKYFAQKVVADDKKMLALGFVRSPGLIL